MTNEEEKNIEQETPQVDNEAITLMEVYNTNSIQAAHSAIGYLSTYGIEAITEHETLHNAMGGIPGLSDGISVMVRSSDYQRALEALIASGRIPSSISVDNKKWYSPLPFMKDAPLWVQLLVIMFVIVLILGALALYVFLMPNS